MEINKMTLKTFKEYEALMAKATPLPWKYLRPNILKDWQNEALELAAVNSLPEFISALREARECFEYLQRHKLLINSHAVAVVCSAALKLSALEGE